MVYDVIHVLLHHSHGRRMSHVFSQSNRKRNKCLLDLPGEARSFLLRMTQFVNSIQGATQAPSTRNPVPLKAQTWIESALWIRTPKPPIFETAIQSVLFGSDAFDEFAWMTEIGYFWSHYVINPGPVLKLSSCKWRTTMLPALIASLIHGGHKRLKMWPRNPFSKWREVISPVGVGVKLLFCYANQ